MHGPVATNILNLYSATLAALSLDVKAARWKVSILVSIVGTGALIWFIQSANWAENFDKWLASVVLWISAWAGVMLRRLRRVPAREDRRAGALRAAGDVDLRRRQLGRRDRRCSPASSPAGRGGTGSTSFLQGPIAKATHNVDLSWLTGFGVAAILYYVLRPFFSKEAAAQAATTVVGRGGCGGG